MVQLKVIIVNTSPVDALTLEEVLRQSGRLEKIRIIGLEHGLIQVPDWKNWDLVIALFRDETGSQLLSLLAPVLRESRPPVIFLVDDFQPSRVNQLFDYGARRVFPLRGYESLIPSTLEKLFQLDLPPSTVEPVNALNHLVSPGHKIFSFAEMLNVQDEGIANLFAHSTIGLCILKIADGTCLDCNESFARLFDRPRDELIGRPVLELDLPMELIRRPQFSGQQRLQAAEFTRQFSTREKLLRIVQIQIDWTTWHDKKCVVVIAQDITDKERDKDKIRRLNDELERLVVVRTGALHAANRELAAEIDRRKYLEDFSKQLSQTLRETSDIVAIADAEGNLQFLNDAGRSLFGIGEDDQVNHLHFFFPYSAEMQRWVTEEVQPELVKNGTWRGEAEFTLPNGQVIPISQVMICKKDDGGNILYYASVARDVSDYKRIELELRQSRERYRTLAEAAHDFIFMVSKAGHMEYANEYACRALGHDPSKVEGIPASQFFPREFAINHLQKFAEVHETDRPVYTEGPFYQGDEQFWMGTWLVPIHNDIGSLVSVLGISRDITEQKKADEALQRALQNERRLGEFRSNFFSMTSHQFRTPLSTILLSVGLLQKYASRIDETEKSQHLMRIQEAARRLNNLLDDILAIGKVDAGRYVCNPKRLDLIKFVDRVVAEHSANDSSKHRIIFQHQMTEYFVFLDPDVMHRIIDNLLSNAIKYSPPGTRVSIVLTAEDSRFSIEVSDQGIGIPEADLQYLFQPFQRGSNAFEYPGTGIGLTIIQQSVDLMGGSVSVKSLVGQGTTFTVNLPSRLVNSDELVLLG